MVPWTKTWHREESHQGDDPTLFRTDTRGLLLSGKVWRVLLAPRPGPRVPCPWAPKGLQNPVPIGQYFSWAEPQQPAFENCPPRPLSCSCFCLVGSREAVMDSHTWAVQLPLHEHSGGKWWDLGSRCTSVFYKKNSTSLYCLNFCPHFSFIICNLRGYLYFG